MMCVPNLAQFSQLVSAENDCCAGKCGLLVTMQC